DRGADAGALLRPRGDARGGAAAGPGAAPAVVHRGAPDNQDAVGGSSEGQGGTGALVADAAGGGGRGGTAAAARPDQPACDQEAGQRLAPQEAPPPQPSTTLHAVPRLHPHHMNIYRSERYWAGSPHHGEAHTIYTRPLDTDT